MTPSCKWPIARKHKVLTAVKEKRANPRCPGRSDFGLHLFCLFFLGRGVGEAGVGLGEERSCT